MSAEGLLLREELPTDVRGIHELVAGAFGRSGEAELVDALRARSEVALSLVAETAEGLVGHVLFSPMEAPMRALGLAPVAVRADARRQGVAAALIREGLARARRAGWEAVFVLGEPAYYERFGFSATVASGFRTPYAGPYFMALALTGPELTPREGTVAYAPPFSNLE